jgi:hypothetical protein
MEKKLPIPTEQKTVWDPRARLKALKKRKISYIY